MSTESIDIRRTRMIRRVAAALSVGFAVTALSWQFLTGGHLPSLDPIGAFLAAVGIILLVCHLGGDIAARLRQPRVIGEVVGGLLLGPSTLGGIWPGGYHWLFPDAVRGPLSMVAQLGLVVFVFLLGCELGRDGGLSRPSTVATVITGAMGLPLIAGVGLALAFGHTFSGPVHPVLFAGFFGLAISITALPVLARVLVDLGLERSPAGRLSLAGAAAGDGMAWAVLTVLLAVASANPDRITITLVLTVAYLGVMVLAVRPALAVAVRWAEKHTSGRLLPIGLVAAALVSAGAAQVLGLHPLVGAFLFGTIVPTWSGTVQRLDSEIRGFAVAILLPVFFAGIGLSMSFGEFAGGAAVWLAVVAVLVVSAVSKFVGAGLGARMAGLRGREAAAVGALMNCRGVTELVVATVGLQHGLINGFGFTALVIMALVTTATTGPLINLILRPHEAGQPDAVTGRTWKREERAA